MKLKLKDKVSRKQGMIEERNRTACMCCSCEHSLEEWPQKEALGEKKKKKQLSKGERVSFAWLCTGHISKDC